MKTEVLECECVLCDVHLIYLEGHLFSVFSIKHILPFSLEINSIHQGKSSHRCDRP